MPRLIWGAAGKRIYETGVDRGVLYPTGLDGVAWNGLVSVTESPSGGDSTPYYIDGYKYHNKQGPEEFTASIEAYTYPDEFEACNGVNHLGSGLFITQQRRLPFGLCYRTKLGNDTQGDSLGYKLHLVYNASASPTTKGYDSVDDSPEAITFNWNIATRPVNAAGYKATPHMIIDTTKITAPLLVTIEDILYGSSAAPARLPLPAELITLFTGWPTLQVIDNGNGTFTIIGPDDVVQIINAQTFQITSETVTNNGDGTFDVTSF